MFFAILIQIFHAHRFGIFRSELEDISNFDTAGNFQFWFSTAWTDTTVNCFRKIAIYSIRYISFHIQPHIMFIYFISATAEIFNALQRIVIKDGNSFRKLISSDKSGMKSAVFCNHSRMDRCTKIIRNLRLICLQIPTDKQYHIRIVFIFLINYRFHRIFYRKMQVVTNLFNRMLIWCIY